jgi:hypothetical protein
MPRARLILAPLAVVSLAAGVAVAGLGSSETTPVTADFQAALVSQKEKPCDASHTKFRVKFQGTLTSSDPRLTGDIEIKVSSVVANESGWGSTFGKVTVRETGGHRPKFRGRVVGVLEPDGGAEGLLTGHTVARPHARLIANFNAQQDPQSGVLTGELGKDSQSGASQDPAILTNACRGGHAPHPHGSH